MEDLLGFILELVVEVLIQIVFEAGVDAASRAYRSKADHPTRGDRRFRVAPFVRYSLSRANPPWTTLKFALLGLGSGLLSLLIFPHPLVHASKLHGISLLISPLITGLVMSFVGRMIRRRGKTAVNIESFTYGFAFAFTFALIRILMVR
jgi:hypothetical protein